MKSLLVLGPVLIVAASLTQLPIKDPVALRAEAMGYWPLIKSTAMCKCGCPCQCQNCKCNCLICNELNPDKVGTKGCSCCLECMEACRCSN